MDCPIHGMVSPVEDDDFDSTCPECRLDWSARGDIYELPRREAGDPPRERPDGAASNGSSASRRRR